jgi:hypothetical protein
MKAECLAFLESLETRKPPVTDGEEELRVLKVLDACECSLSGDGARTEVQRPARVRRGHKTGRLGVRNGVRPAEAGDIPVTQ